jgi:hypothetical protein
MALSWAPIRKGPIYCSPGCGGKCTWAAHLQAKREAARLAKRLGPGWTPHVWENLGWHWKVQKGPLSIRAEKHRIGYFGRVDGLGGMSASARGPKTLVLLLIKQLQDEQRRLRRMYGEATR